MTDTTPEAKTWDLKAALTGRNFATKTVPIFLDEQEMLKFNQVSRKAETLDKDAEAERDAMVLDLADSVIWVTVRSVPRHVRENLDIQMLKDHPVEGLDTMGIIERNKEFTARFWQLYVVAYKDPNGVEHVTTREDAELLIALLPEASFQAVETAIRDLRDGAKSGYENAVMELGFLSLP